jgi:hypothetical protein
LAPPKPPDGGWGWVIVFSCFMCNFIVGKNSFTVESRFKEDFGSDQNLS